MEQKFGKNCIDIETLREFCEREGEAVSYRKGDQLEQFFDQSMETMELRAIVANHFISQYHSLIIALHCATPRERYEMLLQRCPGIMELINLQDIASFLNVHPSTVSRIRRDITFGNK
jgi:hypothetical protein